MNATPSVIDATTLAKQLIPAVSTAGRLIMGHFKAGVEIERKADKSPVTAADREAEAVIAGALENIAPLIPIIGEEAVADGRHPPPADVFFLVDPLDGTRHFVRGIPEFSVNVALVEHGRAVFGLIYGPACGRLFVTLSDGAAYEFRLDPAVQPSSFDAAQGGRLQVRSPNLNDLTAFNSQTTAGRNARLMKALGVTRAMPMGSALKFGLIAAGEGDLYARMGQTYEWDTAAGQAILEAAGGTVTDLEGKALRYGHADRGYLNTPFVAWGGAPLVTDVRAIVESDA